MSPEIFTGYLAATGVPAGLELRQGDRPARKREIAIDRTSTISATELAKAFNERHADYFAAVLNGVFVIRPVAQRAGYLDTAAPTMELQVRGLIAAARKLFAPLDPRIDAPGGQMASGLGGLDFEGDGMAIALDTKGKAVLDVLNEITKKAAGHAWIVVTQTEAEVTRITQIGFIRSSGSTTLVAISRDHQGR